MHHPQMQTEAKRKMSPILSNLAGSVYNFLAFSSGDSSSTPLDADSSVLPCSSPS